MKKTARAITLATSLLLTLSPTVSWASTTSSTTINSNKWVQKSGNWYYINSTGQYTKGWQKVNSKWYFFDKSGVMKTGWLLYEGKWYYFALKGSMVTGWAKDHSKWYYFDPSGQMVTGWRFLDFDRSFGWYYFKSDGSMASGWIKDGGQSYYLLPEGRWAHNIVSIGHFYENNSIKYPGNEIIKSNVELLKNVVTVGQTKEEVIKALGDVYSVDSKGYYWEYSFLSKEEGVFEPIENSFTMLNPIQLGQEKVSMKLLLSWDSKNQVKGVAIAYFSTDHRLHLYKQADGTTTDQVWYGNVID